MSHGQLYRSHLGTLDRHLSDAIERAGQRGRRIEGVLFHAGRSRTYHADDREVPFVATPHFRRWLPLPGPEHVVLARPGETPLVVRVQPRDYWYDTSPPPVSYWEEAVTLEEVESFEQVTGVTGPLTGIAWVGSCPEAAAAAGIDAALIEPEELMAPLDWHRAGKTEHEVELTREACRRAAAGHARARDAFFGGASEIEIHRLFLAAAEQLEIEVPYETIVAFDDKSAILHYQHKRGPEAAPGRVLLLDAGAGCDGYAADITRTWARDDTDPVFLELLRGVDAFERDLVAMVTAGRPYLEIHVETHRRVAALLAETGIVTCSAGEAFDRGLTRTFLPHGVGHQIGIQVHDVGGHQKDPDGGLLPPPEEYPFLRNTRTLAPGHLVTIEPGIYFVPMLLEPLRAGGDAASVSWDLVDRLTPLGGVRIEDNVLCTDGAPRDLTRDLIAGP